MSYIWEKAGEFLLSLLNIIYGVTGSYGLAIILLTVLVRLAMYPLSLKQMNSMAAMQKLQPRVKVLQEKYASDKQKMNEEVMRLYRENNVNPFAGCLPLFIQLPIMILLYNVLSKYTAASDAEVFLGIDLQSSFYNCMLKALSVIPPQEESVGIVYVLRQIAAHPEGLLNFGIYMPILFFVLLIGFLTWFQQRLTSGDNPQMATMNVVMPIFMLFICLSLPGGVLLYWGTSSIIGVIQQWINMKKTKQEMAVKPVLYKQKPQDGRQSEIIEHVTPSKNTARVELDDGDEYDDDDDDEYEDDDDYEYDDDEDEDDEDEDVKKGQKR